MSIEPGPPPAKRLRPEDFTLAVVLGVMMLLPLIEAALRKFGTGISNSSALVQHCTLLVGMIGAAIAARDKQLLSLGIIDLIAKGGSRKAARFISGVVGVVVSALLGVAAMQFVLSEKGAGTELAYGIPLWIVQLALPAGFAAIALRILYHSADRWSWRFGVLLAASQVVLLATMLPLPAGLRTTLLFLILLAGAILGTPIFAVLGGAGLIMFWNDQSPIASMAIDHYKMVTNATLPTVPLFTLAGYFLAEGGASKRLIRLFRALVGQVRGGPAILVALVCAFFTSFTGASGVTILALGGLLMPVLLSAGYSERNSLGLLTGTGSLGMLYPPCLPLIFYGVIAGVDIKDMFLGGILPGTLLLVMTVAWGISVAPKTVKRSNGQTVDGVAPPQGFNLRELLAAAWEARWELLVPVVAFASLFGGFATPVEAAAVTAFYCFLTQTVFTRDLHPVRDVPRVMAEAGVLVGGVLLILGVALGFTNWLAFAEVPAKAVDWVTATVHSKWTFLLLLNLFLLVVGMLMDVYSAIVIVVPLIVPLGVAFGISPVHLGMVFLANLELGFLTPPVGQNLFLSSLRFNKPVSEVFRATLPIVIVFLVGVLIITYVPVLTTALPDWLGR